MADINQVQLPDGSQYNITDTTSGYATQAYVQSAISGITKGTIGLGNVDNTSDANKPVSTAQQTALDAKTNTSVIAYTEASTTATKRYEIGDQFILNGVLYTATAIIANGGTITVGTNCTASDTLIEQIENVSPSAGNVSFDNTGTDLVSEEVESAIKEVNEKVNTCEQRELLYENPSSTTSLNTGTLPLSKEISNFSRVEIAFRLHATVLAESIFSSNVSNNTAAFKQAQMWLDGTHWYIFGRTVSITGDTLTYDSGKSCYDGGTPAVDSGAFIIERVYGIA